MSIISYKDVKLLQLIKKCKFLFGNIKLNKKN